MIADKRQVARAFGRAAVSYDRAAALQRQVADRLLAQVVAEVIEPVRIERILDLGTGTGYANTALRSRFSNAHLLGLDLAEGMLAFQRQTRAVENHALLCADAEQLPLADGCMDLIYSSLAVQWCHHPQRLFAELSRVLKSGGIACLSTLGPGTLSELKMAWAGVDDQPHVNAFVPLEQLQAQASDYFRVSVEREVRTLSYDSVIALMRDLQSIGAQTVGGRRDGGLRGRRVLAELSRQYERFRRSDGMLPASYEIYYLCCRKD